MTSRRKLTAILSADVFGYSRLMGEDDQATVEAITACREIMSAHINGHHGRVVDSPGDALLAEFPSAIEAVQSAVEIQRAFAARNNFIPENRRMQFRIGINLGDVIEQDGALYGDGVNIAARLESLARPGGICISGTVYDQVATKLPVKFESGGDQTVKNIANPVRTYHVELSDVPESTMKPAPPPAKSKKRPWLVGALVILVIAIGAGLFWRSERNVSAPSAAMADAVLAMPTGTSIAVLPFTNMSGDPKEEYFSDGLTEDIITELSRFKDLYVLARNTTFQYKGKAIDVPKVGKELGVKYMLEGSVRRSGDQLRITAQLIDASSGAHIWAEKYDRQMSDIFVVQDEISSKVVAAITGGDLSALKRAARQTIESKIPETLQAYEHVLQAGIFSDWSKANYDIAKAHLETAIRLAPKYARARQVYAYTVLIGWIGHFEASPSPPAEIVQNAIKSVELDPTDPRAHRTAAAGYFFAKRLDFFERHATIAIELAPNDVEVLSELGALFTFSGQWDKGIKLVTKANNLNADGAAGWYHSAMHYDFFRKGRYQEALDIVKGHPTQDILHTQWKYVPTYAELGDIEKAREHWQKCLRIEPKWSARMMRDELRLWNFPESFANRYLESFAKAGYTVGQ